LSFLPFSFALPKLLVQTARASRGSSRTDVIPAQSRLDIVQRLTDLRSKRFTSHTLNDVLILTCWEFGGPTQGLPESHWRNVSHHFALHDLLDSISGVLVHDEFRNVSLDFD